MRSSIVVSSLLFCGLISVAEAQSKPAAKKINFSRDVRPILSENCFHCHGPDKKSRKGDLRLDTREPAKHVLTIDKAGVSELLRRISSKDRDERMPPANSKLSLTPVEIDTLRRWVQEGASYQQHWAFTPVKPVAVPKIKQTGWPKNDIDRFILAKIEKAGLKPSPETTREQWLRRVSFDLTGLPPTLEEIDAFLADKSPQAYEKVVDRLLASNAYGERMASEWLDVARYSDTYGYQVDRDRYVWPWRDWVVKSFNRNMPYDQFITWQLAGDLLPNATDEQILATTFNRLHPQKVEGGSTPEEFRVEYVADRNHTVATAFLGVTLECCRCHSHKYDPITQKEYYQLFAYFNNIDEAGLYSYFTNSVPTPTLRLLDDATKKRIADVQRRITAEETKLAALTELQQTAFTRWLANRPKDSVIPGRVAYLDFEKTGIGGNKRVPGKVGQAVQLTGDDAVGLTVGNFTRNQPFSVAFWMNTPDVKDRAVIFHRSRAWTDAGSRGYELLIEDGKLSAALIHFYPGNAIRVRTRDRIPTKQWQHVTITYDGSSGAGGLQIFVNGKVAELDIVRDKLTKNITGGGGNNIAIGERFRDRGFTNGLVDEFQVFDRQLTPLETAHLHDGKSLTTALATPDGKLSQQQRALLMTYYLAIADDAAKKQRAAIQAVRTERSKLVDNATEIMVMRELEKRRPSFLLTRGDYDKRSTPVSPGTPAVFPPLPKDAPPNRLGLARWLTDKNHPLTARVTVNRYWQLVFGQGIVRTPEDFGSQGQPPTHPALLDRLSHDFVSHGWDVKRLLKQMVLSATYRQTSGWRKPGGSAIHPGADTPGSPVDPENRLLARMPSYRLPAEMLRDNALAVSGLLVRKLGGAPVRPYEVETSFKPVRRDRGEGLYRRSLYTYWKRTAPAPVMMTLDASKREVCRVKRERTASPLQAFVLLNSPQFVEASRMLAQNVLQKHGDNDAAALTDVFRSLTSRKPTAMELKLITSLYQTQRAYYEKHPDQAAAYLKTGDAKADAKLPPAKLAALGVVANSLLNFDECVRKR